ncbi:MAG TPA: hypothetical protein PKO45_09905 [Rubrivivax sp.]|nr:hypothetical protein [Burkholderiales bacterium]HNT39419.1 hypothetical protein [Rubrivivax sp.]
MTLQQALAQAVDGDTIALMPGTYEGQQGVVTQQRLVIRAVAGRPLLQAKGPLAERKAILVVRGGEVTVEGLEFRGARSEDANGAGIRHERGRLTVRDSIFLDNEVGIISSNDESAELVVEDSEFGLAPRIEGGLPHLLYVGRIGRFTLRGSRFYSGFEGHLVKSRARESRITYNLIYDGQEGEASYEIDLPNGGLAWIIGNVIGQGAKGQNPVMLAYGAEGNPWPRSGLYLAHNTMVGNPWPPSWFVRVFRDRLPADTEVKLVNNVTLGLGLLSPFSRGEFTGNVWALRRRAVNSIYTLDFELTEASGWRGVAAPAGQGGGESLQPTAQFRLPRGTQPIAPPKAWSPGAVQ